MVIVASTPTRRAGGLQPRRLLGHGTGPDLARVQLWHGPFGEKSPIHQLRGLTGRDIATILAANANRAPHRRPSFPIPPRGWCAPRPPPRRRGAHRHGSAITLAGTLRRPAVPQTNRNHAAAQDPQAPAPSRVPLPRLPRTPSTSPTLRAWAAKQTKAPAKRAGEGATPLPPHLLAHLLARRHHPAGTSRPTCRNRHDIRFTPQAFPQLSPEACAVLNTPLKDCDPNTLKLLVSAFTQHINQVMSPQAGITDPAAAFSNLWHRLNAALADANPDTSAPATPQAVSATPTDVVSDAPVASPHPPAPPTGPRPPAKDASPLSPLPMSRPPASHPPADPAITAAESQTTPDIAAPTAPVVHASRPLSNPGRSFLYRTKYVASPCRHHSPDPRRGRPMGLTFAGHIPPVSARRCRRKNVILYRRYAASTGPPRAIARRIQAHIRGNERGHRNGGPAILIPAKRTVARCSDSGQRQPLSP